MAGRSKTDLGQPPGKHGRLRTSSGVVTLDALKPPLHGVVLQLTAAAASSMLTQVTVQ
jgi:hypothetical protein